jgi:3-oxoadipate enol-lactonase
MTTHPGLAYDDRGSGAPVIVLVHGHPFDRRMWAPQLDSLTGDARAGEIEADGMRAFVRLAGRAER